MTLKTIFSLLTIFLIMMNCQNLPNKPTYDNPFDGRNPYTKGDPFNLRVDTTKVDVTLIWSPIPSTAIVGYNVYRSTDDLNDFNRMNSTVVKDTIWIDSTVTKGHSYWYKVTAVGENGEESSQTNILALCVDTEPVVLIDGDAQFAYNTSVTLTILAPRAIEMKISNYSNFSYSIWENYTTNRKWDLLAEEGIRTVYVKVKYDNGIESAPFYDSITLDLTSPPMVYIPAGEFTMGSEAGSGDADEQPQHKVYLDDYWIDKYEVTNSFYVEFLNDGNPAHHHPEMKIIDNGDNTFTPEPGYEFHPVTYVTYEDALAYAMWRGASLPTEAQWEKTARGGDTRIYPWGDNLEKNRVNFWNSDDPFEHSASPRTVPVGYYNGDNWNGYQTQDSPSSFGVYDMAGNVWEWCSDWYQADYYSDSLYSNPSGPPTGNYRVIRGGSWADDPYYIRVACRSYRLPTEASGIVGFRCVR